MVESQDFDIGLALRRLIARSGKQQTELAAHMGVSVQAVQKWINKGTIARENLRPICIYLSCSADELLGLELIADEPKPQSQDGRYTDEMIDDTVKIVMADLLRQGMDHSLLDELGRFFTYFLEVLQIRASWKLKPTPDNYVEIGRALERKGVFGGIDERASRTSNTGSPGRTAAKGGHKKA